MDKNKKTKKRMKKQEKQKQKQKQKQKNKKTINYITSLKKSKSFKSKKIDKLDFPNKEQIDNSLNVNFKLIIPSTKNESNKVSDKVFRNRIDQVIKFLANIFMGSTINNAIGTYQYKNEVIKEDVAIISVFTNEGIYNKHDKILKKYIKKKKKIWGQDAMGFEYQSAFYLI